jgi:diguanylate cyclase (GGDEF)-like protein
MRTSDKIARLHGDEFAVLLEATDEDGAKRARERIVNALKGDKMLQSEDDILGQIAIELSIGIGTMQGGKPIQEIYKEAEADMRKIKKEKGVGR